MNMWYSHDIMELESAGIVNLSDVDGGIALDTGVGHEYKVGTQDLGRH